LKIPLDKILHKAYIANMKVLASGSVAIMFQMALSGFALGFIACENPFQTRAPESPERVQGTFVLPYSPGIVFINLRSALAELNVVNYERCFSDSTRSDRQFRFIPEATVANTNPGLFLRWGVREERDVFARMLNPLPVDSTFSLRLDSLQSVVTVDSAIFFQRYELIARHKRQASGVPRKVSGEARFWLSRDQFGDWSIYRWADFSSGSGFTWSTLKAEFSK
jgi:hypothetical protein